MGQRLSTHHGTIAKFAQRGDLQQLRELLQSLQAALPEFNTNRSQYLDSLTSKGQTPLILAAANGHYTCSQLLLEWGAGINSPNAEGNTPLHAAISSRQSHIIDLLLTHDADPFITNGRGFTCMDLAASLGNHTLLRRLENRAVFNGWLMMKVPRFAGLGCEWQPRFSVVTRRTTPPQPAGTTTTNATTTNTNAASHHYVLLAYKAEADVTPSCKVWLDGAVCKDNPNPRAIERLNGAFEPAEVVVRLSSRHKKPEGACPRQDGRKTRYLLFFRPLEGTTASVSTLRRFMNGVNTRQREAAPQPPSISSLESSDEEVARRLQEEEDARIARAIANNNNNNNNNNGEEGGPAAASSSGNQNYNNNQNMHQAAGGSGSSFGGYPQVNYGDETPVYFGLRPAYNSGVQPSAPSAPLLSSLPTAPLASNLLNSSQQEASHPIVSLPSQDPAEFRRSTAPAELQHYAQAAAAAGGRGNRNNNSQENECCVCLSEDKTYAAVHGETMHLSVCRDCMSILKREGRPCPICRQAVERWLRLHD